MMKPRKLLFGTIIFILSVFIENTGRADAFSQFIDAVKIDARARGVSDHYLALLDTLTPLSRVQELAARQPEYIRPIWEYLDHMITDKRRILGRQNMQQYRQFLNALDALYGVPAEILIAIWGVETNFGTYRGDFPVLQALATLGYEGRRAKFGRQQLIAALEILEAGDIAPEYLKGSWAGAMGHTQFIPTTYLAYAVDATDDGKRDIWNSPEDALGSAAHYLKVSGWNPGLTWGHAVYLPDDFDYDQAGLQNKKSINYWRGWGVRNIDGTALSRKLGDSAILLPAGHRGPAFLVTQNFYTILRYNTAPAYALAIGHLSDQLVGLSPPKFVWPLEDRPLHPSEIRDMQSLLAAAGYDIGRIDGVPGKMTLRALRQFQKMYHLVADGYATPQILQKMRRILGTHSDANISLDAASTK